MNAQILQGDSLQLMPTLAADSIDSIITDPPYGLSFMGKNWDKGIPGEAFWREALRVAKPGAHLLAFGGTRTYHRLACAIEDAGWEIRDTIAWVYGSGFPKSLDVSKAIDKAAGAEREVVGWNNNLAGRTRPEGNPVRFTDKANGNITAPATPAAQQWDGWGTALKPSFEPIIVARKPLIGTVAQNVLTHGTGGINVDGCRVGTEDNLNGGFYRDSPDEYQAVCYGKHNRGGKVVQPSGRWPANVIHDGSDEVVRLFPVTSASKATPRNNQAKDEFFTGKKPTITHGHDDNGGSAARFFYCAKASKADRDHNNTHPTVKPTDLMRYLCRLVTPPNGTILDPFTGSGSTGKAAMLEGFNFIGIELQPEYAQIAQARIEHAKQGATLQP